MTAPFIHPTAGGGAEIGGESTPRAACHVLAGSRIGARGVLGRRRRGRLSPSGTLPTVGAGAIVTRAVPGYARLAGSPARMLDCIGRAGERPGEDLVCPRTGERNRIEEERPVVDD